jgi:hypothetical protein
MLSPIFFHNDDIVRVSFRAASLDYGEAFPYKLIAFFE